MRLERMMAFLDENDPNRDEAAFDADADAAQTAAMPDYTSKTGDGTTELSQPRRHLRPRRTATADGGTAGLRAIPAGKSIGHPEIGAVYTLTPVEFSDFSTEWPKPLNTVAISFSLNARAH